MQTHPHMSHSLFRLFRTRLALTALWLVVLSGCTGMGGSLRDDGSVTNLTPPPPYYLRAHLDDPFSSIEAATRRLSRLPSAEVIERPQREQTDLWQQAIERFEFAQCSDFPEAQAWTDWFGERPEYMARVMDRAQPWLYDIIQEIERRDMPGELALLPVIESAYDPFAYSHGRASGTWQFVSATARSHGIQINDYYDGRRDVYVATRAALDYLQQLSQRFDGDWDLALAAYNGGQGRVGRAIEQNQRANRPTDWRSLRLPRETKAYIPKLHGLACLFQSADEYDIELPVWPNSPLVERIELNGPTDVVVFSALLGLEITELMALNPGLNRHITSPSGPHHLMVPIALAAEAKALVTNISSAQLVEYRTIQVQLGDTLSGLALRHDTTVDALRKHNALRSDVIRPNQRLEIPTQISPNQSAQYADRYQELALLQSRLVPAKRFQHEVRPGESLWVIARRYEVGMTDLQRWNQLGSGNLIRPGQRLTIIMEPDVGGQTSVQSPARYTVRNGDSLWAIARRHQIPLNDLMEQNDLNQGSVLRPGQTLTLKRGASSSE